MINRYYRFAGLDIQISAAENLTYNDGNRMERFAVNSCENPCVFSFSQAEKLPSPIGKCVVVQPKLRVYETEGYTLRYIGLVEETWENAHICVKQVRNINQVQLLESAYKGIFSEKTVLETLGLQHLLVRNNGVAFHCSFIEHNGRAVLFTAPSETGKSTQADLWNRYRGSRIVNGDRAAIRIAGGTILAEGIPYAGSSSYCQKRSIPLTAIVYLSQAPKTSIRRLRGYEAFARIWEGITVNAWDKMDMELASAVVKQIAESIPVYHMPCTPDESAVIILEQELEKQVNV